MKLKNLVGVSLSIMIVIISILPVQPGASAEVNRVSMHVVGEEPVFRDGMTLMVAGLWHMVDISTDASHNRVDVVLSHGEPESSERNESNYYHWSYISDGQVWRDDEYGTYIIPEKCNKFGGLYTFYIGVDGRVKYGIWNMSISVDGETVREEKVVVERPGVSSAVSSADFALRIDPFTPGTIDSEDTGQRIRITNTGNTPLLCNISFTSFSDRIHVKNAVGTLHVGDEREIYLTFDADAWSPRVINITGTATMSAPHRIPTNSTASLIINTQTTFSVKVYVGHSGYDVIEEDGFTIQKKDVINLVYGEEADLMFFLTGNGSANMEIGSANCTIERILFEGDPVESPFEMVLYPDKEVNGSVRIKANVPDTTGKITYVINYGGKTYEYFTEIRVGPEPPKSQSEPETKADRGAVTAFLILVGIGATIYVVAPKKKSSDKK